MKKILLASAATFALTSSAFAESPYYLSGDLGMNFFSKIKGNDTKEGKATNSLFKEAKGKTGFDLTVGAGYNFMENARAELALGFYFNPSFKISDDELSKMKGSPTPTPTPTPPANDDQNPAGDTKDKKDKKDSNVILKASAMTVMANGYYDLVDLGPAKLFATAGLGLSSVKAKLVGEKLNLSDTESKRKMNFAYSLGLGADFEIAQGVRADIKYAYYALGKPGKFEEEKVKQSDKEIKNPYKGSELKSGLKGHKISLGVRFAI